MKTLVTKEFAISLDAAMSLVKAFGFEPEDVVSMTLSNNGVENILSVTMIDRNGLRLGELPNLSGELAKK